MATAAFDGTGEAYAHITNDSRVKIWDVDKVASWLTNELRMPAYAEVCVRCRPWDCADPA